MQLFSIRTQSTSELSFRGYLKPKDLDTGINVSVQHQLPSNIQTTYLQLFSNLNTTTTTYKTALCWYTTTYSMTYRNPQIKACIYSQSQIDFTWKYIHFFYSYMLLKEFIAISKCILLTDNISHLSWSCLALIVYTFYHWHKCMIILKDNTENWAGIVLPACADEVSSA